MVENTAFFQTKPVDLIFNNDNLFLSGVFPMSRKQDQRSKNKLKKIRESFLMSKAELARKAGVSPITIDRIEKGMDCRMETKRKILLALGYDLSDKSKVF
jgi:DNA-binding XRE family transcriptional regulator